MPGLIESHEFRDAKATLSLECERLDELFDAMEWRLLNTMEFDEFHLVEETTRGPVYAYQVSTVSPGLVVVFGFESHGGEQKALLLDAWIPAQDED